MHLTCEEIREIFRKHDLRCTHQREIVYGHLAQSRDHPTAEELYQSLHAADPNISLATVYNTLDALHAVGLIRRLPGLEGGACRFDADTRPHVHISTPNGRIIDAPPDLSERLLAGVSSEILRELESRLGFTVSGLTVQIEAGRRLSVDAECCGPGRSV
jgi:Fur family peroxide stress response transcriptional regulator